MSVDSKNVDNRNFAFDSLEAIRNRLLDLTSRNRLLNFRHNNKGLVRVIDEVPNQLATLILGGSLVKFIPVDEPTKEELIEHGYLSLDEDGQEVQLRPDPQSRDWAALKGFDTNYELLNTKNSHESKHNDDDIQTIIYPRELEAQLRSIRTKANTAIEETGANILYLAFGFLEWFEDDNSDVAKHAPLYLIPIRIEKATLDRDIGVYTYTIQYTGEDIVSNLSLREKLRNDFHIGLPEIEESMLPESYMELVSSIVLKHKPRWKVRRFATLAMFDFGKLLMYLDLDPSRWPNNSKNIQNHPILQRFFSSSVQESDFSGYGFSSEYEIDKLEDIHDTYPLIDDADSSQHSALIDAIKGKNLVIEGPPGSGKSQTITNLIAAAISQGKSVLFVAEKKAALEVVKNRLEKSGLGDFCLELHSNKTQKKQVYENIRKRIEHQSNYVYPHSIDLDIKMYEEKKQQLTEYAERINTPWKSTGNSIHHIFTKATRYREQFKALNLEEINPKGISGLTFDELTFRRLRDEIERYSLVFEEVRKQLGLESKLDSHPWFGVYNTAIQMFDAEDICEILLCWQNELKNLRRQLEHFNISHHLQLSKVEEIVELVGDYQNLPKLSGSEKLDAVSYMSPSDTRDIKSLLSEFDTLAPIYRRLCESFDRSLLRSPEGLNEAVEYINKAKALFKNDNYPVSQLHKQVNEIDKLRSLFTSVEENLKPYLDNVPTLKPFISISWQGFSVFQKVSECFLSLSNVAISRRHELFDEDRLDHVLPELELLLKEIKPLRDKLKVNFNLDMLPSDTQLMEMNSILNRSGMFKWFSSTWREARRRSLSLSVSLKPNLNVIRGELLDLARYKKLCIELAELPDCQLLLQHEYNGIDTDIDNLNAMRGWYKLVREYFGYGFSKYSEIASALLSVDSEVFKSLKHLTETKMHSDITSLMALRRELRETLNSRLLDPSNSELSHEQFDSLYSNALSVVSALQPVVVTDLSILELEKAIILNSTFQLRAESVFNSEVILRVFGENIHLDIRNPDSTSLSQVKGTVFLYEKIESLSSKQLKALLFEKMSPNLLTILEQSLSELVKVKQASDLTVERFSKKVKLDYNAWSQSCEDQLDAIIERNNIALVQPTWLVTWVDFIRVRNSLVNKGLEKLLRQVEKGHLDLANITEIFIYSAFDILSREIIDEVPELAQFSGADHNAIRHQFREYDERLKLLQREKIAFEVSSLGMTRLTPGISSGRISSYTEMGLLSHEINKKTRHTPLRQVIKRAHNSLLALKPCFMMGPNSVAQYLEPGLIEFDLVIMDEASQIKPEDSLGTVARGKQLVVVGDPKQLPPTSFFEKAVESENEDLTAIEQSESILDVSLPMFSARRLRWHYRSRHESLIAFSNQEFYDNNLILFPSPSSKTEEFGIKFNLVKTGFYVNQKNIEEARLVAKHVREHILSGTGESLGVVAMSAQQREQIERCVEALSKDDAQFREALVAQELADEPLFIKNLENVQGDERDVIYISFTYGPQTAGAPTMPQRFGPINNANGGRRLNVLFTRSKKRMHIFSSMTDGHILVNENSSVGVKALKKFLSFAQTNVIPQQEITGRDPDSDFEIAVMNALKAEGFECEPQVGEAGYFIDLAVRDPGQPGSFLMGIECDGATYHSSKSARDRDRLRQSVLEGLGWRIHRIWSTDWFKNPQAQLKPIIEHLHLLKTEPNISKVENPISAVETIEQEHVFVKPGSDAGSGDLTLDEKLIIFDQEVLSLKAKPVSSARKLLRPAMIDALCEFRPISKNEFLEVIPRYLRDGTDSSQGAFLESVLAIIAEDEQESELTD